MGGGGPMRGGPMGGRGGMGGPGGPGGPMGGPGGPGGPMGGGPGGFREERGFRGKIMNICEPELVEKRKIYIYLIFSSENMLCAKQILTFSLDLIKQEYRKEQDFFTIIFIFYFLQALARRISAVWAADDPTWEAAEAA